MNENEIGKIVVDAALTLHKELGPGLLELVYEVLMTHELQDRDLTIKRQVPVPIEYKGIKFDEGCRADIIIDDKVILKLKTATTDYADFTDYIKKNVTHTFRFESIHSNKPKS
ncbi:MAG: GxxExxY protein [Candidatus Brocadiales bacterium]|nr:GxxExxY protein [Candidatus Brocadiales bacterium]